MQQQVEINKPSEIQQQLETLKTEAKALNDAYHKLNIAFATTESGFTAEPEMIRMTSAEIVEGEKEYSLKDHIMPKIDEHLKNLLAALAETPVYLNQVNAAANKVQTYINLAETAVKEKETLQIENATFTLPVLLKSFLETLEILTKNVTAVEKVDAKANGVLLSSAVATPSERKNSTLTDVELGVSSSRASMFSSEKSNNEETCCSSSPCVIL